MGKLGYTLCMWLVMPLMAGKDWRVERSKNQVPVTCYDINGINLVPNHTCIATVKSSCFRALLGVYYTTK